MTKGIIGKIVSITQLSSVPVHRGSRCWLCLAVLRPSPSFAFVRVRHSTLLFGVFPPSAALVQEHILWYAWSVDYVFLSMGISWVGVDLLVKWDTCIHELTHPKMGKNPSETITQVKSDLEKTTCQSIESLWSSPTFLVLEKNHSTFRTDSRIVL